MFNNADMVCSIFNILDVVDVLCSIEYSASYFYHTLFAYFDRDNVGLPGFAK